MLSKCTSQSFLLVLACNKNYSFLFILLFLIASSIIRLGQNDIIYIIPVIRDNACVIFGEVSVGGSRTNILHFG